MAYLVKDLTALCRQYMAGFPPDDAVDGAGNLIVLSIANEAQSDVVRHGGVYPEETVVVNLVAGTQRYAIDPTIYRYNAVTYVDNANSQTPLRETSLDELDHRNVGWRYLGSGTPWAYFLDGANIGFVNKPSRTTSGGYPYVSLNVVRANAFATVNDPLPTIMPNLDGYVFAMLTRYSLRGQPDMTQLNSQLSTGAGADLKRFTGGRQVRQMPRIRPRVPRIR